MAVVQCQNIECKNNWNNNCTKELEKGKFVIIDHEGQCANFEKGVSEYYKLTYSPVKKAKKLYRVNEDGVAEWVVAEDKEQAFEFIDKIWGGMAKGEYFEEHLKDCPGDTMKEFIDYFVIEEEPENDFSFTHDNGDKKTRKVRDWLADIKEVPSYFACQEH